ncbi:MULTISPECIES: nicotinate phosphoribosyltransferase [unclassified Candidatus Frackibacter]|uniref:nicotinate phosphoribosyltransferase n=1 Tax=unclassified Candidatus Frackibacter TaxID=2648818 RepID=UPI0008803031|nr:MULTISPECIES: nicotinate phosphoribosyltransferase [unclassified Candidatus Frackibacter]SDC70742.1 nicotinate phosphoribosyltransferase [Candidatus Frackibacter sp. WG11]SEM84773.1 nicotinate phosphoribosyltransferase [Candidatus Frackibacter sp. WG12]SFL94006.1 nicotinate phosphoribosyltransferase [Candidatus Frackibacter sp. WG13]
MSKEEIQNLKDVVNFKVEEDRLLYSANHDEIRDGLTTDIYFIKTREILHELDLDKTKVVVDIFTSKAGTLAGVDEVLNLLQNKEVKVWGLEEGSKMKKKEVVLRIEGAYNDFGIFETAMLGSLASSSGWATAAAECKEVADDIPVLCFGARHLHPAVAPVMERAAIVGGVNGASCILGAKLAGMNPSGTVPHALILTVGDTLKVAEAYDEIMPKEAPRIMLVDTFKDEAEETLRLADNLKERLEGVRLDTPSERGGVTPALVREIRARLDKAGYQHVNLFVSGGINPERILELKDQGVDGFGVGSYISGAEAINMTMDIKEVDGKPIAKRGRIPGPAENKRLKRLI